MTFRLVPILFAILTSTINGSTDNGPAEFEFLDIREPKSHKVNEANLSAINAIKLAKADVDEMFGKEILAQHQQDKPVVVIVGQSGVGKTTIFNALLGRDLVAELADDEGGFRIKTTTPDQANNPIWEYFGPGTKFLSLMGGYCDTPGFENICNDEKAAKDIVDIYALRKLFHTHKRFKLLVAVAEGQVDKVGNGVEFALLTMKLGEMFGDLVNIQDRLNIIVTHAVAVSEVRHFKNRVNRISLDDRKIFTKFQLDFFKFISTMEDGKIRIFKNPVAVGPIQVDPIEKDGRQTEVYQQEVKVSVATATRLFAQKQSWLLTKEMASFLCFFRQHIDAYTQQLIRHYVLGAEELRKKLKGLQEDIDSGDEKKLEQAIATLDKSSLKIFARLKTDHDLLVEMTGMPGLKLGLNQDGVLSEISKRLAYLAAGPSWDWMREHDKTLVTGSGYILGTRDVQKYYHSGRSSVDAFTVCGFGGVLADGEILAPGVSIALCAPFLRTLNIAGEKKVIVKLSGEEHGPSSVAGARGRNGGHFWGWFTEAPDLSNLAIDVNGGRGVHGRDGINGKDGENGTEEMVRKMQGLRTDYETPLLDLWSIFDKKRCAYTSGKEGELGGDASQGGKGGYAGSLHIYLKKPPLQLYHSERGVAGECGLDGKLGKGGMHGIIYRGVYVVSKGLNQRKLLLHTALWGSTVNYLNLLAGSPIGVLPLMGATISVPTCIKLAENWMPPKLAWSRGGYFEEIKRISTSGKALDGRLIVQGLQELKKTFEFNKSALEARVREIARRWWAR